MITVLGSDTVLSCSDVTYLFFFFCKQKTAYEMRISDWSSDVSSSDLLNGATPRARITAEAIAVLSQHGPLAPSIIHQRVDFAASMVDGRTVDRKSVV